MLGNVNTDRKFLGSRSDEGYRVTRSMSVTQYLQVESSKTTVEYRGGITFSCPVKEFEVSVAMTVIVADSN